MLYRVLIIDDERTIAEAVHRLLEKGEAGDLDVYHRTDPQEALALIRAHRFDLVVTDIEMPGMNGLGLADQIRRRWPQCKLIFLTGYQTYEYMRSAVQLSAFDYALKANGLKALMESIERALALIRQENAAQAALLCADIQWHKHRAPLMEACLWDWYIQQHTPDQGLVAAHFPDLRVDEPAWVLMTGAGAAEPAAFQALSALLRIREMVIMRLSDYAVYALPAERNMQCLLLQPAKVIEAEDSSFLTQRIREELDTMALQLHQDHGIDAHFALSDKAIPRSLVAGVFDQCRNRLTNREDVGTVDVPTMVHSTGENKGEQMYWVNIECSLMESNIALFRAGVGKLFALFHGQPDGARRRLSAYVNICHMLIRFTEHLGTPLEELLERFAPVLARMGSPDDEALSALVSQAQALFTMAQTAQNNRKEQRVQMLLRHIHAHLFDELSLLSLSEMVHLNPSYLSRLFRSVTGESLSDYVLGARLQKACQLLIKTGMQVQEIAMAVGFENPSYFATAFRRGYGVSPQECRRRSDRAL